MKNFKIFVAALTLSVSAFLFNACKNNDEGAKTNPVEDSLKSVNGELNGRLSEKEAALQEFIEGFNEIQENLNTIKQKEKIIGASTGSKADVKSKEGQIKEDIQSIYDLMAKNKNRIGSLTKKLKESNVKLSGMEKMIENLQTSLALKDVEIDELKDQIQRMDVELSYLATSYHASEAESAAKTEALNTAFYAMGTSKELKEKKVISKEGGFIGLGKTTKVSADFNKEYFTKVNIEQTLSINIGAKKAKLLTTHPSSSYRFVGEKPVEKIEIINPREFWGASKYLVIVID